MADCPDSLIDEYMEYKYPERCRQLEEEASKAAKTHPDSMGYSTITEAAEKREQLAIERYDSLIPKGLPTTGKEVRDAKHLKRKQRNSNDKPNPERSEALKAFLKVDLAGGTSAEAKTAAINAITKKWPEKKTLPTTNVARWLGCIIRYTNIKPAQRGRPKK